MKIAALLWLAFTSFCLAQPIRIGDPERSEVTLSTDDRHIFDLTLVGEYMAMAEECGFSLQELQNISLTGIRSSFLNPAEKMRLEKRWRELSYQR